MCASILAIHRNKLSPDRIRIDRDMVQGGRSNSKFLVGYLPYILSRRIEWSSRAPVPIEDLHESLFVDYGSREETFNANSTL